MRIDGQLTIEFVDADAADRVAYATIAVSIDMNTEELEEATEDSYDFRSYFPGQQAWSASCSHREVVLENTTRNEAQLQLENLAATRAVFAVTFISPNGTEYDGSAWLKSWAVAGADQQSLVVNASIQGAGELTLVPLPT